MILSKPDNEDEALIDDRHRVYTMRNANQVTEPVLEQVITGAPLGENVVLTKPLGIGDFNGDYINDL